MKYVVMVLALLVLMIPTSLMAVKKKKQGKPDGAFQLIAQLDNGKMQQVGYKNTNILFQESDQKIQAYVGCNTISGALLLKRNSMQILKLIKTDKACPDYIDGLEEQFFKHLEQVNAYDWDGSTLLLMNNKTTLMKLRRKNLKP